MNSHFRLPQQAQAGAVRRASATNIDRSEAAARGVEGKAWCMQRRVLFKKKHIVNGVEHVKQQTGRPRRLQKFVSTSVSG